VNLKHIQMLRAFLTRVDLKGGEVPAFVEVSNALVAEEQALVAQAQAVTPVSDKPAEG
jgi:hypothetical protein